MYYLFNIAPAKPPKPTQNPTIVQESPKINSNSSNSSNNISNDGSSASNSSNAAQTKSNTVAAAEVDLFDFGSAPATTTSVVKPPSSSSSSSSVDIDIDESPSTSSGSAAPISHDEAVARSKAAIDTKVQEALEFKKETEEKAKKEGEEFDIAREKHGKRLDAWAFNGKEKRNVRSLLSTMQTVLWEGNTWKPVGLGDLLDPKQVKLAYRKAMLVVHPDRCSGMESETKFIAKRVFEGVNEAYQDFLKKEGLSS